VEVRRAILDLVERADNDQALRAELKTLRTVKETSQVTRAATRVVILGGASGETQKRGDRCEAASKLRGFHVVRVTKLDDMPATLMQAPADVVIVCADKGVDVRALAKLAQTIDEATAVMIIDGQARLDEAMLALEVGAVDYVAEPYPDETGLARRIERAANGPRTQRDMRRLTFDLIVANRELALARRRVEDEQVKLLNAMIRALEARDEYTAGHTDRVAAISVRCGQALGMEPATLDVVRMGALLHDIGKIGIRDAVLLKPARLTRDEFEMIKAHTTIGAKLLGDVEQFQCIIPIVRGHHEKLDGTGYPDRLVGVQIPLEVRVVSASDVLDALTSTRPYRRGSLPEEAFDIMAGAVGKHLDPVVVDALKQVHKDGRLQELLQPNADEGDMPAPYRES
jgi:putative nucleotidyltransferase with HDIG domain